MLKVRDGIQIYVSLSPIDMRKSIDSLSVLVVEEFKNDPQSGYLFIFLNRSRDKKELLALLAEKDSEINSLFITINNLEINQKKIRAIKLVFLTKQIYQKIGNSLFRQTRKFILLHISVQNPLVAKHYLLTYHESNASMIYLKMKKHVHAVMY
jgi:hypothetical protein